MGFIGRIAQPPIREVFRYWTGLGAGGTHPGVRDLDPSALAPYILPWLFLFRREPDSCFRCLLSGTEIRQVDGYDSTGAQLGELIWARAQRQHAELFEEVADSALPLYYRGKRPTGNSTTRDFASLLLPLAGAGGAVDHVFGVLHVEQPEPILPTPRNANGGDFIVVRASPGEISSERGRAVSGRAPTAR